MANFGFFTVQFWLSPAKNQQLINHFQLNGYFSIMIW